MHFKRSKLLIAGLLACLPIINSFSLSRQEILNIIKQLEKAGFYNEAERYKLLLEENSNIDNYNLGEPTNLQEGGTPPTNDNLMVDNTNLDENNNIDTNNTNNNNNNLDNNLEKDLLIWKYIQENPLKAIEILKQKEKTPQVLKQLGIAYYNLGDYINAIKYLKLYMKTPAFEQDKDKYKLLLLLAYAYKNIFNDEEFKKYIQYVYEHAPQLLKPQDKIVLAYIFLSQDDLKKVHDLINSLSSEDLKKVNLQDLKNLYALYYVKLAYKLLCAKRYSDALKVARLAQTLKPDLKDIQELKAWLYLNSGNYAKAITYFNRVLQYKKDPNLFYGMALAYAKLGRKREAVRYLRLAERGADRLLFYKIANLYYNLGLKREALRIIQFLERSNIGIKYTSTYSCGNFAYINSLKDLYLKPIPGIKETIYSSLSEENNIDTNLDQQSAIGNPLFEGNNIDSSENFNKKKSIPYPIF